MFFWFFGIGIFFEVVGVKDISVKNLKWCWEILFCDYVVMNDSILVNFVRFVDEEIWFELIGIVSWMFFFMYVVDGLIEVIGIELCKGKWFVDGVDVEEIVDVELDCVSMYYLVMWDNFYFLLIVIWL